MEYAEIIDALTQLRESKGWSQAFLARRLDVARQTLHNWEALRRQPTFDVLRAWASELGVELRVEFDRQDTLRQNTANQVHMAEDRAIMVVSDLLTAWDRLPPREQKLLKAFIRSLSEDIVADKANESRSRKVQS